MDIALGLESGESVEGNAGAVGREAVGGLDSSCASGEHCSIIASHPATTFIYYSLLCIQSLSSVVVKLSFPLIPTPAGLRTAPPSHVFPLPSGPPPGQPGRQARYLWLAPP